MTEAASINMFEDRLRQIEQRAQKAEDRVAIFRLLIDLQTAMDERDLEKYGAYYTEDGEWCAISGRAIGPAAITTFLRDYCFPWESPAHRTYHSMSDVSIEIDGDTAIARGQWRHYHPGDQGQPIARHFGHFEAVLARTGTGWGIKRRASYGDLPYAAPTHQLVGMTDHGDKTLPSADARSGPVSTPDLPARLLAFQHRLERAEQRIGEAEDREAIHQAFLDLQRATDERDAERYGQCFTADGEWSGVSGRAVGSAEITAYMTRFFTPWASEAERTYHSISDLSIDLNGDVAQAHVQYRHVKMGDHGHPQVFHFGHFDAELQRTPAGWRFKRRAGYVDLPFFEPKFQLVGRPVADH